MVVERKQGLTEGGRITLHELIKHRITRAPWQHTRKAKRTQYPTRERSRGFLEAVLLGCAPSNETFDGWPGR